MFHVQLKLGATHRLVARCPPKPIPQNHGNQKAYQERGQAAANSLHECCTTDQTANDRSLNISKISGAQLGQRKGKQRQKEGTMEDVTALVLLAKPRYLEPICFGVGPENWPLQVQQLCTDDYTDGFDEK